jgi:hypothetical protein
LIKEKERVPPYVILSTVIFSVPSVHMILPSSSNKELEHTSVEDVGEATRTF